MPKLTREVGLQLLEATKIIAIVRGVPEDSILQLAQALSDGGVKIMEVTLNTPGAPDMIHNLQEHYGDSMWIGAGTVLTEDDARVAHEAGASFFITPNVDVDVIRYGVKHGIDVMPGAMTPTEILTAHRAGATMVKVFPSGSLGPGYFKDVRGPLPQVPLMAVGGVNVDNAAAFLAAGAKGLGIGGYLVDKKAMAAGDFEKIRRTAKALIEVTSGV